MFCAGSYCWWQSQVSNSKAFALYYNTICLLPFLFYILGVLMTTIQQIQKVTVALIFLLYIIYEFSKCYFSRDSGSLTRSLQKFGMVLSHQAHIACPSDVNFPNLSLAEHGAHSSRETCELVVRSQCPGFGNLARSKWVQNYQDWVPLLCKIVPHHLHLNL